MGGIVRGCGRARWRGYGQPNAKGAKVPQRTQKDFHQFCPFLFRVFCETFASFAFGCSAARLFLALSHGHLPQSPAPL
jgi:hypothetical protein